MRRPPRVRFRRLRWTRLELCLIATAVVLIAGSVGAEAYRWISPPGAPAAARAQIEPTAPAEATATPTEQTAILEATSEPMPTLEQATQHAESPTPEATIVPTSTETATTEPFAPIEPTATQPPISPTATLSATRTPLPTLVIGQPPLVLNKSASVEVASPGQQFSYFVEVATNSDSTRTIEVRDSFDQQLEIVEVNANNGSCTTGATVVCVLSASSAAPAQIVVSVRVKASAMPGSSIISQALARDDQQTTAASERVLVVVESTQSRLDQSQPQPPTQAADPAQVQTAPDGPTTVEEAASAEPSPAVGAAADAQASATPTSATPTTNTAPTTAVQRPTPALPPTLAPAGPDGSQPTNPSTSSPSLPDTAASMPVFGLGIGLLGIGLVLHGMRRIRRANTRLNSESDNIQQLGTLAETAAKLQQATVQEIVRMHQQSDELMAMLKEKRS